MSDLPDFIARDGQLLATPPIKMETTLYMFVLDADWDKLNTLCDRYLNLGPTVYRPILPAVMLYCSYARSSPTQNPIGWCPEKDFGFWVPVVAGHYEGPVYVPERVLVFTPYLWVDSGVAMVGGREVYGFPKAQGSLVMPATTHDPATFTVDTQVIPREGPNAEVIIKRLLEVHKLDGGLWDELKSLWKSGGSILLAIEELLVRLVTGHGKLPVPNPVLLLNLLRDIGKQLPMVFLKQFPDISASNKACYQAIVEAPIQITSGVTGGFLGGEYGITINRFDSHEIVENLGLRPAETHGDSSLMKSLLHGWVQFDASVAGGKVIWQRP
jgi:hypothetical protein